MKLTVSYVMYIATKNGMLATIFCVKYNVQPIADRMAQNLEIVSKTFRLAPGALGFSWDLELVCVCVCVCVHILLPATHRIFHRTNSSMLTKFEKSSQDSVPLHLRLVG